jgi:hypothetical protein
MATITRTLQNELHFNNNNNNKEEEEEEEEEAEEEEEEKKIPENFTPSLRGE